ncbi:hypothetical protein Tco_0791466 [Tanacetum coccineum]
MIEETRREYELDGVLSRKTVGKKRQPIRQKQKRSGERKEERVERANEVDKGGWERESEVCGDQRGRRVGVREEKREEEKSRRKEERREIVGGDAERRGGQREDETRSGRDLTSKWGDKNEQKMEEFEGYGIDEANDDSSMEMVKNSERGTKEVEVDERRREETERRELNRREDKKGEMKREKREKVVDEREERKREERCRSNS